MKKALIKITAFTTALVIILATGFGINPGSFGVLFASGTEKSVLSGSLENGMIWTLDSETGLLTVIGEGEFPDYSYAFELPWSENCDLIKNVVVDSRITGIPGCSFSRCENLVSITVPPESKYLYTDEYGVLYNKEKTELIVYPAGNERTSYTVPDGVQKIYKEAFSGAVALSDLSLPDSIERIGEGAFAGSGFYKDISNWINSVLYLDNCLISAKSYLPETVEIKDGTRVVADLAMDFSYNLKTLIIPDSVKIIGERAFMHSDSLESVTIGNGIEYIGEWNFFGCDNLAEVSLPDKSIYIGEDVFDGTAIIKDSSRWADGVFYIDNHLISSDYDLVPSDYKIKPGTVSIAGMALYWCKFEEIVVPDTVKIISESAFWSTQAKSVTLGSGVEIIGTRAFGSSDSLTDIIIPEQVKEIGAEAFQYCYKLESVEISGGNIGVLAFDDCPALKKVVIGDRTEKIGSNAFSRCPALSDVSLGDAITHIGSSAFYNCTGIKSLVFADSLVEIENHAFYNCVSIGNVTFGNNIKTIGAHAFHNCKKMKTAVLPESLVSIGDYAFYRCTSVENISIPDSVTSVGKCAFRDCSSATSLSIGNGLTSISNNCFSDCSSLKNVVIPENIVAIDSYAFAYCYNLESIFIPETVTSIGTKILNDTNAYICSDSASCHAKTYADDNGIEFILSTSDSQDVSEIYSQISSDSTISTQSVNSDGEGFFRMFFDFFKSFFESVLHMDLIFNLISFG